MAQYIRPKRPGATTFFTVCLAEAGATTLVDNILLLRGAVRSVHELWPFQIEAWVVMPDHIHSIWTLPDEDTDYAMRWASIKSRFSRGLPDAALTVRQTEQRKMGLWQRGVRAQPICDTADLDAYTRHCWMDPVRHGFVAQPRDWPYSSYHRDVEGGANDQLTLSSPGDWAQALALPAAWL